MSHGIFLLIVSPNFFRYGLELLKLACEEEISAHSLRQDEGPVDYDKGLANLLKATWGSDSEDETQMNINDNQEESPTKRDESDVECQSPDGSPKHSETHFTQRKVTFDVTSDGEESEE